MSSVSLYIKSDVRRLYPNGKWAISCFRAFLSPRYHPVMLYRLTRLFVGLKMRPLAYVFAFANLMIYRVEIALDTEIGPGLEIPHGNCIIGAYRIGSNFTIFQGCTIGSKWGNLINPQKPIGNDRPIIGDDVIMFTNSVIVGPINIGSKCVIGANTVVVESLNEKTIVRASPPIMETIQ